jgi:hypothetical protein
MLVALQTNGAGPAGRQPNVSTAVFDNATHITEIGYIRIREMHRREPVGFPVEPLQTARRAHPQIALGIVVNRQDRIIPERGRVVQDMIIGLKFHPVETVQSIIGTNPYKPHAILIDAIDMAIGQSLLQTIESIGIGGNRKGREV